MGSLDSVFRQLAAQVLPIFASTPVQFKRVETFYDSTNDVETQTERTAAVVSSPPVPVTYDALRADSSIQASDTFILAASKDFEELSPAFDPKPGSKVKLFATVAGRSFSVVRVREYWGGDQPALLEFILRD